jgi:tryptophan synthase alpha chain
MASISTIFQRLAKKNRKALIPFITAHFPNRQVFNELLHQLPDAGADIIEIGIPFSDPMADGWVIQKTSEIALANGFQFATLLDDIQSFKSVFPDIPIVLMTYLNPLVHYGMDQFIFDAESVGVNGALMVDLPPEHHHKLITKPHALDIICLVTATTKKDRLPMIQKTAGGFIYYVAIKGVTGSKLPDKTAIESHLTPLKSHIQLPVVVGFGINSPTVAKDMASVSDGIIVGSAFIAPFIDANNYDVTKQAQLQFLRDISHGIHA